MPTATTPDGTLTADDLQTAMEAKKPDRVAVVYSKIDGRIELVYSCALSPQQSINVNLQTLMPGADERQHELVWVPYTDGDMPSPKRHRVVIDVNGNFIAIKPIQQFGFQRHVDEDEDTSTTQVFSEENAIEINADLLRSNMDVITHVLDQIQDTRRLIQYQLAEASDQNRTELMEYFKNRGL